MVILVASASREEYHHICSPLNFNVAFLTLINYDVVMARVFVGRVQS